MQNRKPRQCGRSAKAASDLRIELERLRAENEHLRDDILKQNYSERLLLAEQERERLRQKVERLMRDIDALRPIRIERDRLREALEFYAGSWTIASKVDGSGWVELADHPLKDLGARARAALKGKGKE